MRQVLCHWAIIYCLDHTSGYFLDICDQIKEVFWVFVFLFFYYFLKMDIEFLFCFEKGSFIDQVIFIN